jgi:hypothetical protein
MMRGALTSPTGCRQAQQLRVASYRRRIAPIVASANAKDHFYTQLKGVKLIRSSDAAHVALPDLWGPNERAVVAFGRSFG